ncbi:MAG: biotin--[acetyl-CoA-carboxylase] ligase [Chitinophagaceae bacterium]|nr:biotin--[acetyl-CoA-carboxylase] ligase [Chitinophagaceae bacterium]
MGEPFFELYEVDSTNIYAIDKVQANLAAHGAAFFANSQFAGKGQRGKIWNSESGSNIILSVVIDPSSLLINQQFAISAMASLAVYDFFVEMAGEETKIKWPNDLYWRDRKAGGILIYSHIQGKKWQYAILGIGININQTNFSDLTNQPVSLKQITGKSYQPVELAKQLCVCLEQRFKEMENGGIDAQLKEYNQHLYKRGEEVRFKKENIAFSATVQSVNGHGELVLKNGLEDHFGFGELNWLIS